MATYYVRLDGSDSNTGLGSTPSTAWRTVQKALGATGIGSGDTVYIAPGRYNEFITVGMTSATATTSIIADVSASQFQGVTPGLVRLTAHATDAIAATGTALITATSKNYLYWQGIYFEGSTTNNQIATCRYWTFDKCAFVSVGIGGGNFFTNSAGVPLDLTISKCVFVGSYGIWIRNTKHSSLYDLNVTVSDCFAIGRNSNFEPWVYLDATGSGSDGNGIEFYNCTLISTGIYTALVNATFPTYITNCLAIQTSTFVQSSSATSTILTNTRYPSATVSNATIVNSSSAGVAGVDFSLSTINNSLAVAIPAPYDNSILLGAGTTSGAPVNDIYGLAWSSNTDIGAFARATLAGASLYIPTEQNLSAVSITAGSTSRSLYLYLGATGLTATTTGLQAYYTKEDATTVSIPLVAQTTTGAWVSGGFAEVSAANQPGVYRLDIPNAAISAGYNQTVVTVRGASGTNGAVVVIQEPPVLGSQVRMGPFTVQADGVLTDERLKLYKGSIHSIDFKMVDQYGTGVDGTGTVVTANVYNSAGFLVDSYSCTAKYAEDGRYSFAIDATVTNVVGMYTINISRQIGSEVNVFGRMKLEVLSP